MKTLITSIAAAVALAFAPIASAQTVITKVDRVNPTDEVFMDMATSAAQMSKQEGGKPEGAVIILNNAFHSSGKGANPEQAALAKARVQNLGNANVYTVNEPTPATVLMLSERGVRTIFFVNPAADVIAAGVRDQAQYAPVEYPEGVKQSPVVQISYPDATALLK